MDILAQCRDDGDHIRGSAAAREVFMSKKQCGKDKQPRTVVVTILGVTTIVPTYSHSDRRCKSCVIDRSVPALLSSPIACSADELDALFARRQSASVLNKAIIPI